MKNAPVSSNVLLAVFILIVVGTLGSLYFPASAGGVERAPKATESGLRDSDGAPTSALAWHTFLGGPGLDRGNGIAVDGTGKVFVCGETFGGTSNDAFVARLNAASGAVDWLVIFGGASGDGASACIIDPTGKLYVSGNSDASWGSPLTAHSGGTDGFVARLDPANGSVMWNTFLGGTGADFAFHLSGPDAAGNLFAVGDSNATWGNPVRPYGMGRNATVVSISAATGARNWNTFLGGGDGTHVAFNGGVGGGGVFVTGYSSLSWGTPVRPFTGFQQDVFLARLDAANGALSWNTFVGGTANDVGQGLVVDPAGDVYITGESHAAWGTPVTPFGGCFDAFAAKFTGADGTLTWHTFIGGSGCEVSRDLAMDNAGNLVVSGSAFSSFGTPTRPFTAGGTDGFALSLNSKTGAFNWNTFLGGTGNDVGYDLAVDGAGNTYVIGESNATWGTPVRPYTAGVDAFVARLGTAAAPSPTATATVAPSPTATATVAPSPASISGTVLYGTSPSTQAVPGVLMSAAGSVPQKTATNAGGSYTLTGFGAGPYTVTPSKNGSINGSITGLDAARVAQHVAGLITLSANQQIAGDATGNGSLSGLDAARIAQHAAGLANPGIAGQWVFVPPSRNYPSVTGATTGENYTALLIGDVTGNWTPPVPRFLPTDLADDERRRVVSATGLVETDRVVSTVLPSAVDAEQGAEFKIPIPIARAAGKGIVAYDFTLDYDPAVLEPDLSADWTERTLSEGWSVVVNTETPGFIKVTAYSTAAVSGSGTLLNIAFRAVGSGRTELKWTSFELNEGEVPVTLPAGTTPTAILPDRFTPRGFAACDILTGSIMFGVE